MYALPFTAVCCCCGRDQLQAVRWIRAMEAGAHLESVNLSSPLLVRTLEAAVRLGRPLLIEDCTEKLDPVLENVRALCSVAVCVCVCVAGVTLWCCCDDRRRSWRRRRSSRARGS